MPKTGGPLPETPGAPAASNLSCIAEPERVAFLWDAPEWSGGTVASYDYQLVLPDGREEGGRLTGITLVYRPGSYGPGKAASFSIRTNYETPGGRSVVGAAAELTCHIEGAQPLTMLTITPGNTDREYGQPDSLSYAVSGLVDGDAAGDVVSGSLGRAPGQDAGAYPINLGTLAIVPAYADKYRLPDGPATTAYTITPKAITAVGGVTVNTRAADGTTDATFDTSGVRAAGVLPAEVSDFQSGGLAVSGKFPSAEPGAYGLRVTYSLQDSGGFKAGNYTLSTSAATATLQGRLQRAPQLQQTLSSDATLSGLELLRGGNSISLRPAFSSQTTEYGTTVPLGYQWVKVKPTASHTGATITVEGKPVSSGSNSGSFFLGINTPKRLEVTVSAEDGATSRVYAVTATYTPRAQLADLSVSGVKLHPLFSGLRTDYRGWVPHGVDEVRVTPTNRYTTGSITVNGAVVASGAASAPTSLTVGENVITVKTTSPDNYTSRTYTVTVVRATAAASGDATLRGLAVHRATSNQPEAGNVVPYEGPAYELHPALTPGVYDYLVRVPELEPDEEGPFYVTAVVTTTAPGAKSIVVKGNRSSEEARTPKGELVSGEASGPWQTYVGYGLITIEVTSLDGNDTETYRVIVEQGSVNDPSGVALTPGNGRLTLSWGGQTGRGAPQRYLARWREVGTTTWLNDEGRLDSWQILDRAGLRERTAADGYPVKFNSQGVALGAGSYAITGLTNGTEYEVQLRSIRNGSFLTHNVLDWLKSEWVTVRGTPGEPARELVITPTSPTRAYGAADDLGYAVSGLMDGDAAGDVVTGMLSRAAGDAAGTYAINMGTLAIASAYTAKYTLPASAAVATYTITPKPITAISGVTVNSRVADGTTAATFDTSAANGTGVLAAELADFRAGGLQVSGAFPAATPGTHNLSATYSLRNSGTFKAANYTLSATTATLRGELTEETVCAPALILAADAVPAEGHGPVTVTVALISPADPGGVTVTLTTSGTATSGADYTLSTTAVHIAAGATAGTATLTVVDDSDDDDYETIILNAAVSGSSLSALPLTLTITDDDDAPVPVPTTMDLLAQGTPTEGGDPVDVVVRLDHPVGAGGMSVRLTTTGTATRRDYSLSPTTVNIAPGESSGTAVLTVVDDAVYDNGETVIIHASARGHSIPSARLALAIVDNDAQPVSNKPAVTPDCRPSTDGDYDDDNDGLIEVCNRQQLEAINYDLDGDGSVGLDHPTSFPNAAVSMGCPSSGCIGYELITDLDLYGGEEPWYPIGLNGSGYAGVFEGNGHTISNVVIADDCCNGYRLGLFRLIEAQGVVRNLNIRDAYMYDYGATQVGALAGAVSGRVENVRVVGGWVAGSWQVGRLLGRLFGSGVVTDSYAQTQISAGYSAGYVGGLIGLNSGKVRASFASGTIRGPVHRYAGGLVGWNANGASIMASGALVNFLENTTNYRGGLVGLNGGAVVASYSAGSVGENWGAGLIYENSGTVTDSYWDYTKNPNLARTFARPSGTSGPGVAMTTDKLREPQGYSGIYANWNIDLDGDGNADDPWDFGTACQYPIPKSLSVNPPGRGGQCPLTASLSELRLLKRLSGISSRGQVGDNLIEDSAITDYTVRLAENVLAVSLTPTAQRPAETVITVDGRRTSSGKTVHIARPGPGRTKVVNIRVTEGDTVRLYTLSLMRGSQP